MHALRLTFLATALVASALTPQIASAIPTTASAKVSARYDLTLINGTFIDSTPGVAAEDVLTEIGDVSFAMSAIPGINCPANGPNCIWQATADAAALAENGAVDVRATVGTFSATIVASALAVTQLTIAGSSIDATTSSSPGDGVSFSTFNNAAIFAFFLDGDSQGAIGAQAQLVLELTPGTHILTWGGVEARARAVQAVAEVPAPATLPLLAAGLAALAAARRRQNATF